MTGRIVRTTGFLIENGKQGSELRYLDLNEGMVEWTADHQQAVRFCRRVDADKMCDGDPGSTMRIVEHEWVSECTCGVEGR